MWDGPLTPPQFSNTARSFPCDVSEACSTSFLSALRGPCNQREPICLGWLLIWPWPPASGLCCPSRRFGSSSHLDMKKPSLEGFSYHLSHRENAEKWAPHLCVDLLMVIVHCGTQAQLVLSRLSSSIWVRVGEKRNKRGLDFLLLKITKTFNYSQKHSHLGCCFSQIDQKEVE